MNSTNIDKIFERQKSISITDFSKYLKYKNKYLQLKNKINVQKGGSTKYVNLQSEGNGLVIQLIPGISCYYKTKDDKNLDIFIKGKLTMEHIYGTGYPNENCGPQYYYFIDGVKVSQGNIWLPEEEIEITKNAIKAEKLRQQKEWETKFGAKKDINP